MLFLGALFAVGALLFFFSRNILMTAISPLWKTESRVSKVLAMGSDFFRFRQSYIDENNSLKSQIASLEAELSSRSSLSREESVVLTQLGRVATSGSIAATVLVRPPQSLYDTLVIDAGKNESIRVGQEVSLPEGPLLGTVSEVFYNTAKVKLFSSAGEKINAVLERSNLSVALEGIGGGNFKIVVPRETPVEVGDRILSTDAFAHLVGVVGAIKVEPTDSFKEVLAKGPSNIFNLRFVLIK